MKIPKAEIYVLADSGIGPSATGGRVLKLVAAPPSPALLNLSTRLNVGTGENVLIGGFVVVGSTGKPVLLRGIGPSLSADGASIPGRITDPLLELHDGSGGMIASNDDWVNSSDKQKIINTGVQPSDNKESALLRTLSPGAYTAVLRSANASNGVGLIERTTSAILAGKRRNISTRGFVQTGDDVMIGGFILGGSKSRTLIARAIGPSLLGPNVNNPLPDPILELHNGSGTIVASNDDWRSTHEQKIQDSGLAPQNDKISYSGDCGTGCRHGNRTRRTKRNGCCAG